MRRVSTPDSLEDDRRHGETVRTPVPQETHEPTDTRNSGSSVSSGEDGELNETQSSTSSLSSVDQTKKTDFYEDDDDVEIEKIMGCCMHEGQLVFLVKLKSQATEVAVPAWYANSVCPQVSLVQCLPHGAFFEPCIPLLTSRFTRRTLKCINASADI